MRAYMVYKCAGKCTLNARYTFCPIFLPDYLVYSWESSNFASVFERRIIMSDYSENSRYYDPYATITDIEVMLHVSYRTAARRMAEMKKALGIDRWKRPTKRQIKAYFMGV